MIPVGPIWAGFTRILGVVNDVLSIIPALVWAAALAVFMFMNWHTAGQRDDAVLAMNEAKGALEVVRGMIKEQKRVAAARLAELTAEVKAAQSALDEFRRNQEKADAIKRSIIDDQARRLAAAAAANGGKLRDPNASGCRGGGGGPEGQDPARPVDGAADAPQAGGLLSAQLSGLLQRLTREADAINDAYAVCKPDTVNLRRQLSPSP